MEREEMWSQLANAVQMRSSQDQVLWSILGTFWATNALLLVALFTTGDFPTNPRVGVVVALAGFLVSLVWNRIQDRALGHIERHELLIESIETELELADKLRIRKSHPNGMTWPPARRVMRALSIGALGLWAFGLTASALSALGTT